MIAQNISNGIYKGEEECVTIVTTSGDSVTVTNNCFVLLVDGFMQQASKLTQGTLLHKNKVVAGVLPVGMKHVYYTQTHKLTKVNGFKLALWLRN